MASSPDTLQRAQTGLHVDTDGRTVRMLAIRPEQTFIFALAKEEATAFALAVIDAAHAAGTEHTPAMEADLRLAQVGGCA